MFIPASNIKNSVINIEFLEYSLENGLHVILHKDNTNPIVCVNIWYHVGSKDEEKGKTGFAHLFEHMMFQGSENVGKTEHLKLIQSRGGYVNGTTNQDRTNYFELVPSSQLELLLWLESDRMATLNVTEENFNNQREVVKEEKRMRYDNVPYGNKWEEIYKRIFKEEPYEWTTIGSIEDLNNASLEYAQEFYNKYYSPDNAVLVVAGDIDYEKTKKLIQKYFGNIKPSGNKKKIFQKIKYNFGEIRDTIYDNIQLPAVYITYKTPGITNSELPALELASKILGDGKSSRLYKDIVYNKKIAKSANAFLIDCEIAGMLTISSIGFKDTNTDELINNITEITDVFHNIYVSDEELEKAKNSLEYLHANAMQSILSKSEAFAFYCVYFKDTNLINNSIEKYLKVSKEDIKEVSKKYLNRNNRVILTYLPRKK